MTMEKLLVLLGSKCDNYDAFLACLDKSFPSMEVFYTVEEFTSRVKLQTSQSILNNQTGVGLFFIESDLLPEVYPVLDKQLILASHILVSFSAECRPCPIKDCQLFDHVNTSSNEFDMEFFIKRLQNEVANKTALCRLRNEVREFSEIGKSLSSEKDTVKLLDKIITSCINLTSSDAGTIYLVVDKESTNWSSISSDNHHEKLLKFVIAKNTSMDVNLEASTSPITRQSVVGYAVAIGTPVRIDDAYNLSPDLDYRHNNSYDIATGYVTKSMLAVPMKDHLNNIMGVLQLINKKTHRDEKINYSDKDSMKKIIPYDATDELIMNSLAGQAAVILENNLLYRDMNNLLESYKTQNEELKILSQKILKAHEEERKRIGREIHDGPAQSVVNLSLKIELCKKLIQVENYEKAVSELDTLNNNIRATSKEIRTILYDLKPSYLEEGLFKALQSRFEIFEENTGIKILFNARGDDSRIEYFMSSTIYRIIQESLSNIFKHAKARNVVIEFKMNESYIVFSITDDGKGFNLETLEDKNRQNLQGGFGLGGIKERVEIVKGSVKIESAPGKGTSILVTIPLGG